MIDFAWFGLVVSSAGGRTGTDYQQVVAGRQATMAGAGRQNDDIAGLDGEGAAAAAAELNAGVATGDSQHLVRTRVEKTWACQSK